MIESNNNSIDTWKTSEELTDKLEKIESNLSIFGEENTISDDTRLMYFKIKSSIREDSGNEELDDKYKSILETYSSIIDWWVDNIEEYWNISKELIRDLSLLKTVDWDLLIDTKIDAWIFDLAESVIDWAVEWSKKIWENITEMFSFLDPSTLSALWDSLKNSSLFENPLEFLNKMYDAIKASWWDFIDDIQRDYNLISSNSTSTWEASMNIEYSLTVWLPLVFDFLNPLKFLKVFKLMNIVIPDNVSSLIQKNINNNVPELEAIQDFSKREVDNKLWNYNEWNNFWSSDSSRLVVKEKASTVLDTTNISDNKGKFYVERSNGVVDSWWDIVWRKANGDYIMEKFDSEKWYIMRKDISESKIKSEDWSFWWLESDALKFEQHKSDFLKENSSISESDFHNLFEWDFSQWQLWNCYWLSAIYSLKNSPHFESLLRTSLQKVDDWYYVRIPLWDLSVRPIHISNSELWWINNMVMDFNNNSLRQLNLSWAEWYRVLEAALIKYEYWSAGARARLLAEWWDPNKAINQLIWNKISTDSNISSWWFNNLIDSGHFYEVANFLDNFDPLKDISSIWSIIKKWHTDSHLYKIWEHSISYWHAYSIKSVDKFNKIVEVVNPHDTWSVLKMSYEDFMKSFSTVRWKKINYEWALKQIDPLMNEKKDIWRKISLFSSDSREIKVEVLSVDKDNVKIDAWNWKIGDISLLDYRKNRQLWYDKILDKVLSRNNWLTKNDIIDNAKLSPRNRVSKLTWEFNDILKKESVWKPNWYYTDITNEKALEILNIHERMDWDLFKHSTKDWLSKVDAMWYHWINRRTAIKILDYWFAWTT